MKLNHVALTVTDVSGARRFLETYFGMKGLGRSNPAMAHLADESGLVLSLFRGSAASDPQTTHIGFMQESEADVNRIYERLKGDGFEVEPPQRSHGWTFYVVAPGGFCVEVVC